MTTSNDSRSITCSGRMELVCAGCLFSPFCSCFIQDYLVVLLTCTVGPLLSHRWVFSRTILTDASRSVFYWFPPTNFSPCYDKRRNRNNPWEEGFAWLCCFIGSIPFIGFIGFVDPGLWRTSWWQEHVKDKAIHLMLGKKQRARQACGSMYNLLRHALQWSISSNEAPESKISAVSPNTAPNWLLPCSTCESMEGHLILCHNILPLSP